MPTSILYIVASIDIPPPRYAMGTDAKAKGQNNRQEKCPAMANRTVVTNATMILSASAVGFITSGENESIAIVARYPDAPACPTVEYRRAITKKYMPIIAMSCMTITLLNSEASSQETEETATSF